MSNPFQPPQSHVEDITQEASLSKKGLITLFHRLVLGSLSLGIVLSFLPWLPLPISYELQQSLQGSGLGAIVPQTVASFIWWAAQPLWVVASIGLYFFRPWARWLFAAVYAISTVSTLFTGAVVHLPWESAIQTLVTLLDGALFALVFLPPLSHVFGDRSA